MCCNELLSINKTAYTVLCNIRPTRRYSLLVPILSITSSFVIWEVHDNFNIILKNGISMASNATRDSPRFASVQKHSPSLKCVNMPNLIAVCLYILHAVCVYTGGSKIRSTDSLTLPRWYGRATFGRFPQAYNLLTRRLSPKFIHNLLIYPAHRPTHRDKRTEPVTVS